MNKHLAILLVIALALSLVPHSSVSAATSPDIIDNVCVVLVLDESGSMQENDPNYLRNTGAKLLISVLDDGDGVGIVRFSTSAHRLTPELVTLDGPQNKLPLLALLDDEAPEGFTDMKAALADAGQLLEGATCGSRAIILLSDGQPQLEEGLPDGYETETVDLVRNLNVPVFGIALTVEGESGLLYRLAAATNPAGHVIPARDASDLLDAYLDVVARLKDRTVIGSGFTTAPGNAPLPLETGLAQYVSRVTYIVSKPAGVTADLQAPGGAQIGSGSGNVVFGYEDDAHFTAFTIENPAPGDWQWSLSGAGEVQARAILRSRLRIVIEQPGAYHGLGLPMPISVSLIEEELDGTVTTLIGQASFNAFIIRPDGSQDELDQLYDDGTHGDGRAGDGVFTNDYVRTELPGEYTITITGYKGVIPATRTLRVIVTPFPEIEVLAPDVRGDGPLEIRGEPLALAMELAGGEPPQLDTGAFIAAVTGPDNETTEVVLARQDTEVWTGSFVPTANGAYTIIYRPEAATYKGVPYNQIAVITVEVRLVPTVRLTMNPEANEIVEVSQVAAGTTIAATVVSSSLQPEPLQFELIDMPDLTIVSVSPEMVPPGESTIYITLRGSVEPGEGQGALLVSSRPGVDLTTRELPFSLHIYQPALLVESATKEFTARHDRQDEQEFSFTITSQSQKDEMVQLQLLDAESVTIVAEPTLIPAGETGEIYFRLGEPLEVGRYEGEIHFEGRTGVEVQPATMPFVVAVTPVPWCARWCLPLSSFAAVFLIVASAVRRRQRRRPRPYGMLQPVKIPPGQSLPSALPVAARGHQVVIGSDRRADLHLAGGGVQPRHAVFRAREEMVMERVGQPPQLVEVRKPVTVLQNSGEGLVKVNGLTIAPGQESAGIQTGARIRLGEYEFVYRT